MTTAERRGLEGEVIDADIYGLRGAAEPARFQGADLPAVAPDVVLDLGGNVGFFASHARSLWPGARIISVEPHPENLLELQALAKADGNMQVIEAAIGVGPVWRVAGSANGAMECYVTAGSAYPEAGVRAHLATGEAKVDAAEHRFKPTSIPSILPSALAVHVPEGARLLVKVDVEGGEHSIFDDPDSMALLRSAEYVCMEIHRYAIDGQSQVSVNRAVAAALASFAQTHVCWQRHVNFYARRWV